MPFVCKPKILMFSYGVCADSCVSATFLAPVQAMDGMVEVLLGRQAKDAEHGLGVLSRLPAEKVRLACC